MFDRKFFDYIGDISQIGGIKKYTFTSGKAKGVEAFDVNNGSGLVFTVVADRGLDIYQLSFMGIPVSFISKTGIVSPHYYNSAKFEWLRSFTGGFLTTCGLTHVGDPCTYKGDDYGLHGHYSNLPADNINIFSNWEGSEYVMKITGEIRQAKVQFENLLVRRSITTVLGKDELILEDEITNEGSAREPFMILYHMNFGYPFINPDCNIVIPTRKISGWDEFSGLNTHKHLEITEPDNNTPELCYYHDVYCDSEGNTGYLIANKHTEPDIAVSVSYNKNMLDNLTQWKYLRRKDYVVALEPCNNQVKGVEYESNNGTLKYIEPGETIHIKLSAKFIKGSNEIKEAIEAIRSII